MTIRSMNLGNLPFYFCMEGLDQLAVIPIPCRMSSRALCILTHVVETLALYRWFATQGYPAYSLSVRGHGDSWYPSFWEMLFTSKSAIADDVVLALKFIQARHANAGPMSLVGHSAGGGLIQYVMDSGRGTGIGKLAIIAGFPCYGG